MESRLQARGGSQTRNENEGGRTITAIGQLGEFGLIDRFTARFSTHERLVLGPGDDAAVVAAPDGRVAATTDLLIEGRHFRRDWSPAYEVGRKAVAQNLADVAAVGAVPTALLIGFAGPPDVPADWIDGVADGVNDECALLGVSVAGGDVSRAEAVVLAVTALGDLEGRTPVTRGGARPGNTVAIAGRIGWAAAGYALLARGFRSPRAVVAAHHRPRPPYGAGPAAAGHGATSMCDVSDGLLADLGHLAAAGGVRVEVESAALEVPDQLREVGRELGVDPLTWMLAGGDDHALVATFPGGTELGPDWRAIGRVHDGAGVTVDGATYGDAGFDHFA